MSMRSKVRNLLVFTGLLSVLLPVSLNLGYYRGRADALNRKISATRSVDYSVPSQKVHKQESPSKTRHKTPRDYCSDLGKKPLSPSLFKDFIVDDRYKLIYCPVPKAASSNWRRVFLILTGKMNTSDPMQISSPDLYSKFHDYLTYLGDLPLDQIQYRLKHYYKFVITREPFERILSAYRNKLQGNNPYFHARYGKNILQRFRVKASQLARNSGSDVTFYEFLSYLVDPTRTTKTNEHWERITELCHPCLVNYDFMGKYDNLQEDTRKILGKVGAADLVTFPERGAKYKHKGTGELLYSYYSQIPPALLEQLYSVYYSDYVMFGYKIPQSAQNLTRIGHDVIKG